jgi:LacI family transcriptional regulator
LHEEKTGMKKKHMTIADIAKEAGVSKASVSRVLSNSPKVRPELKEKILQIMKYHSFVPNKLAQGLAGSSRHTVGIIIEELSNFFFIEVADGFDRIISQAGYSMQISSSKWNEVKELELVQQLISSRVDGIILSPVSDESESIRLLKDCDIPFLLINIIPKTKGIAYISCDNYAGGKLAADYFNKMNRPLNILITGFPHQTIDYRVQGFREKFSKWDSTIHYKNINTFEQGYEIASVLKTRNNLSEIKTALFVTNDNVAIGVIKKLLEIGISIPGQVSVMGYDDIKLSSFCRIPLTTISQNIKDIGIIAAMELLEMIHNPEKAKPEHKIAPRLVVRESAVI